MGEEHVPEGDNDSEGKALRRASAEFAFEVFDNASGAMTTLMAALGDRLGLFAALAEGDATPEELARRVACHPRYLREWASALTAAGYLAHDPATGRFSLPDAHRAALSDEGGTLFQGGMLQNLLGVLPMLDQITDAFRTGAGVDPGRYPPDCFEGMARMTGAAHENVLVPKWLPTVPDVEARLIEGCSVADVGCGQGRALVSMAWAFPASRFTGYDPLPVQLDAARQLAADTGVSDRVRFIQADALDGLPDPHDVICLFDMVHDTADPVRLLHEVRRALTPDGVALILEPNAGDTLADNAGPLGAFQYGTSVLYCLPVARSAGAEGLGTCGSTEANMRGFCMEAGFRWITEAPIDNRFNRLWVANR